MNPFSKLRLSPREKGFLLAGVLVLSGLFLYFGWISPTLEEIRRLDKSITSERGRLQEVRELFSTFQTLDKREAIAEEKLQKRTQESFSIASVIEGLAREVKILDQVQYLKPSQAQFSEQYTEASVSLKVTQIEIEPLVDFLYRIESSERLLRIRSLQVRSHPKETGKLDVTLTVFTLFSAAAET
jgi:type II secretory pathway component PulM